MKKNEVFSIAAQAQEVYISETNDASAIEETNGDLKVQSCKLYNRNNI